SAHGRRWDGPCGRTAGGSRNEGSWDISSPRGWPAVAGEGNEPGAQAWRPAAVGPVRGWLGGTTSPAALVHSDGYLQCVNGACAPSRKVQVFGPGITSGAGAERGRSAPAPLPRRGRSASEPAAGRAGGGQRRGQGLDGHGAQQLGVAGAEHEA